MYTLFAEHFFDLLLGAQTHSGLGNGAVFKDQQGRNAGNAVLDRKGHLLVHIDLTDGNVFVFLGNFMDDGGDHLTGTAPGGPEIQQHRTVGIQHRLLKIILCEIHYRHNMPPYCTI